MTRVVLCSINARFIHTNLAVRSLRAYLALHAPENTYLLKEWHGKESLLSMVRDLCELRPDMVLFSVYIWNRTMTLQMTAELKKVLPQALIVLGGPEVSYTAVRTMEEHPAVDHIIAGEGEETARLLLAKENKDIPGLYGRKNGKIIFGGDGDPVADLDTLPFPYRDEDIPQLTDRILYYESSRGCPFSCAYCVSAIAPGVRYLSVERTKKDIAFFLRHKVPLVKFVDRTFNADPKRAYELWKFILEQHAGTTCFHFEIAADLLTEDALALLNTVPAGMFQFEIGIQSTNPAALARIGRRTDIGQLRRILAQLPRTIHTHVDLIAGLPEEDLRSFEASFNFAIGLRPDMLQLGFLKVLPGTPMETIARNDGYAWLTVPPYEVLHTPCLSFDDLSVLKDIETLLDTFYNSGKFPSVIRYLCEKTSPFSFFRDLARTYRHKEHFNAPRTIADHFAFLHEHIAADPVAAELLRYDFIMTGKHGRFPAWYERRYSRAEHLHALNRLGAYGPGHEAFRTTDLDHFSVDPATYAVRDCSVLFRYTPHGTVTVTL